MPKAFELYLVIGMREKLVSPPRIFEELRLSNIRLAFFSNESYLPAMNLARKFDLYPRALFQTEMENKQWPFTGIPTKLTKAN